MKVIVLGSGKIGSVMAKDFSKTGAKITMSDISLDRAEKAAQEIGADYTEIDTADYPDLVRKLQEFDLVLGALPGDYGFPALKAAIEARKNMVDVSFTPEEPLTLNKDSKDAGTTIIPDCGVAPGLSNLLVGYSASRLDKVEKAEIMVGGIPEILVPPLDYTITWSADGLIDEYIRDVNIIQEGKKIQVPALSGLENIQFPDVGTLEAFYTDGLRSLASSFPDVDNMYEKTLRYPGHVEKIKLIKELGFFSEDPVTVLGSEVTPKLVTARLLERSLWKPEIGDLLAMMIEVTGIKNGKKKGFKLTVLEYQDHETGISAMARTTAYTASIVAGLLADGYVKEKGVIPMEKLGQDHSFVKKLFSELSKRDVEIRETEI